MSFLLHAILETFSFSYFKIFPIVKSEYAEISYKIERLRDKSSVCFAFKVIALSTVK